MPNPDSETAQAFSPPDPLALFRQITAARAEAADWLHGPDRPIGADARFAGVLGLVRALIAEANRRTTTLADEFAQRAVVYERHPEFETDRYLDGYATGMRVAEKLARNFTDPTKGS